MTGLRAFIYKHRVLSMAVLLIALCVKVIVPSGFMIGQHSNFLVIEICQDSMNTANLTQIAIPVDDENGGSGDHDAKGACPFATLSMAALSAVDLVLLAAAIAYIWALGFISRPLPVPNSAAFLRPPSRGPPLFV